MRAFKQWSSLKKVLRAKAVAVSGHFTRYRYPSLLSSPSRFLSHPFDLFLFSFSSSLSHYQHRFFSFSFPFFELFYRSRKGPTYSSSSSSSKWPSNTFSLKIDFSPPPPSPTIYTTPFIPDFLLLLSWLPICTFISSIPHVLIAANYPHISQ